MTIRILAGDICAFSGDVVVNAANNAGLGGGGVDGAIHRAAGPRLLEACKALPVHPGLSGLGAGMTLTNEVRIPTGKVIPTHAGDLKAKWVFHTAGPVFPDAQDTVAGRHLIECYRSSMNLAATMGLKSIAFPAISAGLYGCPMSYCALIALNCAWNFLTRRPDHEVAFYVYPKVPNFDIWCETAHKQAIRVEY